MKKRHLVIGSSAASIGVLTKLRALAPADEIICLTAQQEMPYNTCLLADHLSAGSSTPTFWTKTSEFFATNRITLSRNTRITELDPHAQFVRDETGKDHQYDTLFLGIGTSPIWLPQERPIAQGYYQFHSLTDLLSIEHFLQTHRPTQALVIGAGLSGIECADALVERGLHVTVIEGASRPLPTLVNDAGGITLDATLRAKGVTVHYNTRVQTVLATADRVAHGVLCSDGSSITAPLIIAAVGARPNTQLAAQAGLTLAATGIAVSPSFATSIPNIFAGGDVASMRNLLTNDWHRSGAWPDAMRHGMLAAQSITGSPAHYPGLIPVLSSKFFGTQFVSCGSITAIPAHYQHIEASGKEWYHLLLLDGQVLKGFLLIGILDNIGELRRLVTSGQPVENITKLLPSH